MLIEKWKRISEKAGKLPRNFNRLIDGRYTQKIDLEKNKGI
jgi:hypothetical protein